MGEEKGDRMTPRPRPIEDDVDARLVAGRLRDARTAFLECRTIGHSWRLRFIGPVGKADGDIQDRARRSVFTPDAARVLRCSRCRTERVDLCVVGYGRKAYSYFLTSRSYRYPDGYAIEGAADHRDLIHLALFEREGDL